MAVEVVVLLLVLPVEVGSEIDLAKAVTAITMREVGVLGTTKSSTSSEQMIDVRVLVDQPMSQLPSTGDERKKTKLKDGAGQLGSQRLKESLLMIDEESRSLQEEEKGTRGGARAGKSQKNLDIQ